jgi:hypothetical protein
VGVFKLFEENMKKSEGYVSDAWKAYLRRKTNTINQGNELPRVQEIKFGDF